MTTDATVREYPILFSGEMVKAILDSRKTQTRRVIKPQPVSEGIRSYGEAWAWNVGKEPWFSGVTEQQMRSVNYGLFKYCPYGQPGGRLWVREAMFNPINGQTWTRRFHYLIDGTPSPVFSKADKPKAKPSIHMPRSASRITLEIVKVRVERIQDISVVDIDAEGCQPSLVPGRDVDIDGNLWAEGVNAVRTAWRGRWDNLNADRGFGWEKNPWVWVIEFRRVQ